MLSLKGKEGDRIRDESMRNDVCLGHSCCPWCREEGTKVKERSKKKIVGNCLSRVNEGNEVDPLPKDEKDRSDERADEKKQPLRRCYQ